MVLVVAHIRYRYATMKQPHIIHKIPCSWDIILYGGGPGLYSGDRAYSNPRGCTVVSFFLLGLLHSCGGGGGDSGDWLEFCLHDDGGKSDLEGTLQTPIRLMHGTGGSFKKHPLGKFHEFFRGDQIAPGVSGLDPEALSTRGGFQPRPVRMDPHLNRLAVEQDPHRARHDRIGNAQRAAATPPAPSGRVHIMMFVCGETYAPKIMHFLKALLFHRSTHLHFHFVGDADGLKALKKEMRGLRLRGNSRKVRVVFLSPFVFAVHVAVLTGDFSPYLCLMYVCQGIEEGSAAVGYPPTRRKCRLHQVRAVGTKAERAVRRLPSCAEPSVCLRSGSPMVAAGRARCRYPRKFSAGDYMGACCRIRLMAEQILPDIDAVVVLDGGDQLIFEDIARLWAHFGNFEPQQYAGFALEPPTSRSVRDTTQPPACCCVACCPAPAMVGVKCA
jgi:hypothetical protein